MLFQKSFNFSLLIAVLVAMSIQGCGKSNEDKKMDTQVVAKVNGDEISIHQVNFQLSRLGQLTDEQSKGAAKQVLSRLIDQQLLMQKAMETKLDRDPKVLQAIENAKREILAQAYIERQIAQAAKPSEKEVDDFYNSHPELFEKRRVYRLQELAVQVGKDKAEEIGNAAKSARKITDVATWLKSMNYQFSADDNVRGAEQLPGMLLSRLQNMKDGDMVVVPSDKSVNVVQIVASQDQPIAKDKAAVVIQQYFLNQHKIDILKQEVEKLHSSAKIEYLGVFSGMQDDHVVAAKETQKQSALPQANAPTPDKAQEHMDKGIASF